MDKTDLGGFAINDIVEIAGLKPDLKAGRGMMENVLALKEGIKHLEGVRDISTKLNASYRREINYHNPKEPRVNVPWMIEEFKAETSDEAKKVTAYKALQSLLKGVYIMNRLALYDYAKDTGNKWKDRTDKMVPKIKDIKNLKMDAYAISYIKKSMPMINSKKVIAILKIINNICDKASVMADADIRKMWMLGLDPATNNNPTNNPQQGDTQ